ncbi:MAG: TerB family tellurite resistance protein [Bacteroidales bacterium]|nr:TerB family tellurite resistance protein [Bacteroidales bacterium]
MSIYKWILTGLGWASSGPIGALMGFLLGRIIEGVSKGSPRLGNNSYNMNSGNSQSGHHGSYRNTGTQEDIDVALLVLIASVMKSDGEVRRTELDYVKQFLLKNYGEEKGKSLLAILRDLVKPETNIDLNAVCGQIKPNTDYTTRYHMVDFLFGLAVADGNYSNSENATLRTISNLLGINMRDYVSIFTRHVSSRYGGGFGGGSSYGSGYSRSYSGSTSSSSTYRDPYKVLGLDSSATDDEVKKAYRRMAMKYHPDKVESMGEEVKKNAEAQFREINEAYEQIKTARGMK